MLGLSMINLKPNLKSMFTHYKDIKGNDKWRKWGSLQGYGSPKVAGNVTIRYSVYDLLFD